MALFPETMRLMQSMRDRIRRKAESIDLSPIKRGSLTKMQVYERMQAGGTSKPLILLKGIIDNEITIIMPKKYTVNTVTSNSLFVRHENFPDHYVNINYIVEDGYTCLVKTEDCRDIHVNICPGFDNEEAQVVFANPLLNKQAKKVLTKWDDD